MSGCDNLKTIRYGGNETMRRLMTISSYNYNLFEAEWIVDESFTIKPGDANGDLSVDMKDVLLLRQFIAGLNVSVLPEAVDVNGDQSVDMKDVLALRKLIAAGKAA